MKTPKIIWSLAAFAFALGSSYVSSAFQTTEKIRVQFIQGGTFSCISTNKTCDEFGGSICKIQVQTQFAVVTVNAHPETTCAVITQHTSGTLVGVFIPNPIPFAATD